MFFKIYEKEHLLEEKDTALPVLDKDGKAVKEIKAEVKDGYAVAEIQLKHKNEDTFKKWKKTLRKDQDTYISDNLFISLTCKGDDLVHSKQFLKENSFSLNACKWHDPLDIMVYRGWYGPSSNRWEPKSSAYLKSTTARNSGKHEGLDLYAPIGTTTYACVDGEVYLNYFSSTYGNCFGIKSTYYDKLLYFFYAHLDKKPNFKIGDKVKAGKQVGVTGVTGNANKTDSKKNHLHFEVRDTNATTGGRIDPLKTITELNDNIETNPTQGNQN